MALARGFALARFFFDAPKDYVWIDEQTVLADKTLFIDNIGQPRVAEDL